MMVRRLRRIKVLGDKLRKVEIELSTLKLERLSAGIHTSVSQPTNTNLAGPMAGRASMSPLGPEGHDS